MNDLHINEAKSLALKMLDFAQVGVSGHKVGAAVVAENKEGNTSVFGGCNIEWATSLVIHAERVAMIKAISEGFTNPKLVVVTSLNKDQRAALCGYCRQDYMYLNENCEIIVINPDGSEKIKTVLIKTLNFPYLGRGKIQN